MLDRGHDSRLFFQAFRLVGQTVSTRTALPDILIIQTDDHHVDVGFEATSIRPLVTKINGIGNTSTRSYEEKSSNAGTK